jgi:hypothetical protein
MSRAAERWEATMTTLLVIAMLAGFLYGMSLLARQQVLPPRAVAEAMEQAMQPKEVASWPPSR